MFLDKFYCVVFKLIHLGSPLGALWTENQATR